MKIGIIGAGYIGSTAARLFVEAGHEVAISNSRAAETLADAAAEIGAAAMNTEDAARFGEVVLLAIPLGKYQTLPAEEFAGKIVIDANNYYPERDGQITELDENSMSSSELVAAHLKNARVVKAFNTIYYKHLAEQGDTNLPLEDRRAIFVASDDTEAKKIVSDLIEEIGFAPVDTGNLRDGGLTQEPGTAVYNRELTANDAHALLSSNGGY
jgi:8-hydroxy-5-deazaflavin:NADPH oxidoreductase